MPRVLIVDDDKNIVAVLQDRFEMENFEVEITGDCRQVARLHEKKPVDLVVLDMDFGAQGEKAGLETLKNLRQQWTAKELPVIIITAKGDPETLFESLGQGAADFIKKPIDLKELIRKAKGLTARHRDSLAGSPPGIWQERLVGTSRVILDLAQTLYQAAQKEVDTLLVGETGSGKDLLARTFHQRSPRAHLPFRQIDCATIPPNLFETEIFGFVPGAHSEAKRVKKGRIEEAEGGIAFFNEIGELPLEQQGKLLTLLDSKTMTRVGSNEPLQLDVVILAATNRNLEEMVARKTFRLDLYQRLKKNEIRIPPLREHAEDIPLLVNDFILKFNQQYGKNISGVTDEVLASFQRLSWPGNIRELQDCIDYGVRNCWGPQAAWNDFRDFIEYRAGTSQGTAVSSRGSLDVDYQSFKAARERSSRQVLAEYLRHHLAKQGGNKSRTAKAIGITREYLNQLLERCGEKRGHGGAATGTGPEGGNEPVN